MMECVICHDSIYNNQMFTTTCGHIFHGTCIRDCLSRKQECPTCRKPITSSQIFQIFLDQEFFDCKIFQSSINELKVMMQEQSAQSREAAIKSQAEIESLREEIREFKDSNPPAPQAQPQSTSTSSDKQFEDMQKQLKGKDQYIKYLEEQNRKLIEIKDDNCAQIEIIRKQLDAMRSSNQPTSNGQPQPQPKIPSFRYGDDGSLYLGNVQIN